MAEKYGEYMKWEQSLSDGHVQGQSGLSPKTEYEDE